MATKKKPKLYTNTGKVKKPVARKPEPAKNLTAEYAEAMVDKKYPKLKAVEEKHKPEIDYKGLWDSAVEINKNLSSIQAEAASRTIKLWFGWSLVRPDKK